MWTWASDQKAKDRVARWRCAVCGAQSERRGCPVCGLERSASWQLGEIVRRELGVESVADLPAERRWPGGTVGEVRILGPEEAASGDEPLGARAAGAAEGPSRKAEPKAEP